MTFGHGGNIRCLAEAVGCAPHELLDFSANINPLGPPAWLPALVQRQLAEIVHYPDPRCLDLRRAVAALHGVEAACVVPGNGSTELLYALPRALMVKRAVIPVPAYIDYAVAAEKAGLEVVTVELKSADGFAADWERIAGCLKGGEMVIVGQPSNPAGVHFNPADLLAMAARFPATFFVVDEAFVDFTVPEASLVAQKRPNIIVLRSMTKIYAIPGLRLGYAVASEPVAEALGAALPPWSVSHLAQAVGVAALEDRGYAERSRATATRLREELRDELGRLGGLHIFPSAANYLLIRLDRPDLDAPELACRLLQRRIAIRVCANYAGLDRRYFRVAVRTQAENRRLVTALEEVLAPAAFPAVLRMPRPKVPALMFQGTSSNAGKSILTAAFCRILLQDGFRVAPFKAQNMSLNSQVTREGHEIGRAQAVQAQACRLEADARMNPILLKPNSDTGAQVIVMGKPVGNMDVAGYIGQKARIFETVKEAYDSLSAEVDAMVIEGAGSPAEVNLKHHDIVNMAMARHAQAPVLLVGDIDRGGLFAAFIGTWAVLAEEERARLAGFVINRFRGRRDLLNDAILYTRQHTGLPTMGVIPLIAELGLPEEDSVAFKAGAAEPPPTDAHRIEIAVIDLPHIANFTDFDALALEPDVRVRIVRRREDLGTPDAVVIPGSKNTLGDLRYLHAGGLAEAIMALNRNRKCCIVGICAGLQILGQEIADPYAIESPGESRPGLGLLPVTTVLEREKTLKAASGRHLESGLTLRGYEIHHGASRADGLRPAVVRDDDEAIGYASADGRIFGTYLHGLFDADPFRRWFIDRLRLRRGWAPLERVQRRYDIEPALDRLAEIVRAHLDVPALYKLMGLKR